MNTPRSPQRPPASVAAMRPRTKNSYCRGSARSGIASSQRQLGFTILQCVVTLVAAAEAVGHLRDERHAVVDDDVHVRLVCALQRFRCEHALGGTLGDDAAVDAHYP